MPTLRFSTSRITVADAALLLVPVLTWFPFRNNDLWWQLAAGRWMARHRSFMAGDPFSFTGFMGSWIDNEWLSQVIFYGTWSLGGVSTLLVLRGLLYTLLFVVVRGYLSACRAPSTLLPALVVGIAGSYQWWELRPSVFSLIGTMCLLWVLEHFRRTGRKLWLVLPLFVLWANLHPGFVFGLAVLFAVTIAVWLEPLLGAWPRWTTHGSRMPLLLAAAGAAGATLVNPYGWSVYLQHVGIFGNPAYRAVLDEYAPPPVLFVVFVLATCASFVCLRWRRVPLAALVPVLGAAALSVVAVRFQEYFAIVALSALFSRAGSLRSSAKARWYVAALMAGSLALSLMSPFPTVLLEGSSAGSSVEPVVDDVHRRMVVNALLLSVICLGSLAVAVARRRRRGIAAMLAQWRSGLRAPALIVASVPIAAIAIAVASLTGALPEDRVEAGRYPVACLQALPGDGDEHAFHRLSWGGWLLWRRGIETYIDGRGWGQPLFAEYSRIQGLHGPELLRSQGIEWAIVARQDPLALQLERRTDWELVCEDPASVLFTAAPEP